MKASDSSLRLSLQTGLLLTLCAAPLSAGKPPDNSPSPPQATGKPTDTPPVVDAPKPGGSKKTTSVDFGDNNGWGNGDQDAPGNSGNNNNAENGPGSPPPGIVKKFSETQAPASDTTLDATQIELARLESEALASQANASSSGGVVPATKVVARRVK